MKRRRERPAVLHRQGRAGGEYIVTQRGQNVLLTVNRGGDPVKLRMGQGRTAYYAALWVGEARLSHGRDRQLLEWNDERR